MGCDCARGPPVNGPGAFEALVEITRQLERALAACEFESALAIQDELRARIDAWVASGAAASGRECLEALDARNAQVLGQAERAREQVLAALGELARRRRAVDSYAAGASGF